MKTIRLTLVLLLFGQLAMAQEVKQPIPSFMKGNFADDYNIKYSINDTLWIQHPNINYHIIKWNIEEQYLIAKNDSKNKADANKYTRIDFMTFEGMPPWLWGFCLTAYKANTDEEAEKTAAADRKNPKKGCNGYPFSRMKVIVP
jgi:hypothetical protein